MNNNRTITAFGVMWFGQTISLTGTSMSHFAMMIWVWNETGKATSTVLTGVAGIIPSLIVGLVAASSGQYRGRVWVCCW